jgi:hypothetical protein
VAGAQDERARRRERDEPLAVREGERQRDLDEDVAARVERGRGLLGVDGVGRGDDDGPDLIALEDGASESAMVPTPCAAANRRAAA